MPATAPTSTFNIGLWVPEICGQLHALQNPFSFTISFALHCKASIIIPIPLTRRLRFGAFFFLFFVLNSCCFFPINLFIYLFFYFWPYWVFVAACGLPLVEESGGYSSLRCAGFSLRWLLLLRSTGSRHTGSSSCGTWASVVVARRP